MLDIQVQEKDIRKMPTFRKGLSLRGIFKMVVSLAAQAFLREAVTESSRNDRSQGQTRDFDLDEAHRIQFSSNRFLLPMLP
jgi:hypothetical protein